MAEVEQMSVAAVAPANWSIEATGTTSDGPGLERD